MPGAQLFQRDREARVLNKMRDDRLSRVRHIHVQWFCLGLETTTEFCGKRTATCACGDYEASR